MRNINNIKKLPAQVAQLLAQNDTINRLLTIDTNSALNDETELISLNDLITQKYVNFFIPTETAIEDCKRNTMINIVLDDVIFGRQDNNTTGSAAVYIITDINHLMLDNRKNRLLELIDEVTKTLDNTKFTSAGKIEVTSATSVVVGEFFNCYRINLSFNDQVNERAEI